MFSSSESSEWLECWKRRRRSEEGKGSGGKMSVGVKTNGGKGIVGVTWEERRSRGRQMNTFTSLCIWLVKYGTLKSSHTKYPVL